MSFWFVFVAFVLVLLFEGTLPLKKCLNFDDPSGQEKAGHHFSMNFFEIGHAYEVLTILFGRNIYKILLWSFAISNQGKFWINP